MRPSKARMFDSELRQVSRDRDDLVPAPERLFHHMTTDHAGRPRYQNPHLVSALSPMQYTYGMIPNRGIPERGTV
ncbi:hypothetical protein GCM10009625_36710 [Brachybacterium fresconis]